MKSVDCVTSTKISCFLKINFHQYRIIYFYFILNSNKTKALLEIFWKSSMIYEIKLNIAWHKFTLEVSEISLH